MIENNGIVPTFSIQLSRDALKEGEDIQLEAAMAIVENL
jgi:hypothetical protein